LLLRNQKKLGGLRLLEPRELSSWKGHRFPSQLARGFMNSFVSDVCLILSFEAMLQSGPNPSLPDSKVIFSLAVRKHATRNQTLQAGFLPFPGTTYSFAARRFIVNQTQSSQTGRAWFLKRSLLALHRQRIPLGVRWLPISIQTVG